MSEQRTRPVGHGARFARWLFTPGRGLGWFWLFLIFTVPWTPWGGRLWGTLILVACMTVWVSMLAVAALVPPPTRLADESALARRLLWFLRVAWAAAVFGLSALYGAFAGLSLERRSDLSTALFTSGFIELVLPILAVVAFGAGWYTVMMCAWDLWRVGQVARSRAVASMVNWAAPRVSGNGSAIPSPLLLWVGGVITWCAAPARAVPFGYLAPIVLIALWNSVASDGITAMGLFW